MVFPLNNLPSDSAPWARQIQNSVEELIATSKANDVNAAARNKQFTATVKRLDGAITSLATKVGSIGSINFTGTQTFTPAVAAAQAIIARGYSGQTANIQEWQNSAGSVLAKVGPTGDLTFGYGYTSGLRDTAATGAYLNMTSTNLLVNTRSTTNKGLVVQGIASQTANLQEWQDSTGTAISKITASGVFQGTLSTPVITNGIREVSYLSGTGFAGYTYYWLTNGGIQYITANSTANGTVNITGSSTQTLNSLLSVGDTVAMTLEVTNGASAFYPNAWQIDGTAITPKYQGGTVISSGNTNSIDAYAIVITKTSATPTYTMLVTQTKYA